VLSMAVMYTSNGGLTFGLCRIGGDVRILLRSWNICSHSSPQENFADFLRS